MGRNSFPKSHPNLPFPSGKPFPPLSLSSFSRIQHNSLQESLNFGLCCHGGLRESDPRSFASCPSIIPKIPGRFGLEGPLKSSSHIPNALRLEFLHHPHPYSILSSPPAFCGLLLPKKAARLGSRAAAASSWDMICLFPSNFPLFMQSGVIWWLNHTESS